MQEEGNGGESSEELTLELRSAREVRLTGQSGVSRGKSGVEGCVFQNKGTAGAKTLRQKDGRHV